MKGNFQPISGGNEDPIIREICSKLVADPSDRVVASVNRSQENGVRSSSPESILRVWRLWEERWRALKGIYLFDKEFWCQCYKNLRNDSASE